MTTINNIMLVLVMISLAMFIIDELIYGIIIMHILLAINIIKDDFERR